MLANTSRPKTFSEVVGQILAVKATKAICKAEKLPTNSIVLQGSYGCGKTTIAKIAGKAFNCAQFKKTGEVCNTCDHCKKVNEGKSEYYFEYDSSRVGNVEDIKSLIDSLSFSVPKDKIRVVVLDEVHACSNQALTALLKVIEDGIPNTVFIFCTTEPLMKTIMSRSTVIPIITIPHNILSEHVRNLAASNNIQITDSQIDAIVIKSEGHARNACQLLDLFSMVGEEAVVSPYPLIKDIFLAILKKQPIDALLEELTTFPTATIAPNIALFLTNCFSSKGAFETRVKETGYAKIFFNHFYTPQVQKALQDEYGIILSFKALL